MASSGIRRKVDDLGRVVIPASIRRSLGMREGDAVEVTVEGERVVLTRPRDACVFCGREEAGMSTFRGRLLCRECLAGLGVLDERTRVSEEATQAQYPPPAPSAPGPPEPSSGPTPVTTSQPPSPPPRRPAPRPASASRPAPGSTPTPRPVPAARTHRPPASGPIDGDAWARAQAQEEERPPSRRRPPQDPASTTAW